MAIEKVKIAANAAQPIWKIIKIESFYKYNRTSNFFNNFNAKVNFSETKFSQLNKILKNQNWEG